MGVRPTASPASYCQQQRLCPPQGEPHGAPRAGAGGQRPGTFGSWVDRAICSRESEAWPQGHRQTADGCPRRNPPTRTALTEGLCLHRIPKRPRVTLRSLIGNETDVPWEAGLRTPTRPLEPEATNEQGMRGAGWEVQAGRGSPPQAPADIRQGAAVREEARWPSTLRPGGPRGEAPTGDLLRLRGGCVGDAGPADAPPPGKPQPWAGNAR